MLIYNQKSEKIRNVKYGKATLGNCGCEAIAAYNAMEMLGRSMPLEEVIKGFERRFSKGGGFLAGGRLGATPRDISLFLRECGMAPKIGSLSTLSSIKAPGVFIISYWNMPITQGIHTVAVSFDGEHYTAVNYLAKLCSKDCLEDFLPRKYHFIRGLYLPSEKQKINLK